MTYYKTRHQGCKKMVWLSLIIIYLLVQQPNVRAATGDLVASVLFAGGCNSSIGVGITFDGTHLWYSCYSSNPDLYRADPVTGAIVATYNLKSGLGALAYDKGR